MGDGVFSVWHLLILAGVFILLFGAKRLPDAARHLGKSMRIFKTEIKGLNDEPAPPPAPQQLPATPAPVQPVPPVQPEQPQAQQPQVQPPTISQTEPAAAVVDSPDPR